ncbi:MAG: bestrophin family ion channel, partial [Bacteroidota bacterium]
MFVNKNLTFRGLISFSGHHLVWLTAWMVTVTAGYQFFLQDWLSIPWFPITVVGTAVAFYVGFKNNQAYDRLWEARKIWGAIVNSSRAWASTVKGFVTNQFADSPRSAEELYAIRKQLIYRHIGWLYALRSQLLVSTSWEHINQNALVAKYTKRRQKTFGLGLLDDGETIDHLKKFLPEAEYDRLVAHTNTATQIIDQQSQELMHLRGEGLIDDFRHMELQKILYDFYVHQGKCERIKKFPLPRQYGGMSFVFVGIFIFILPFGMASEFAKLGDLTLWLSVPFSILLGWVYLMMELVGDYSENPFEGLGNDIPMLALSRTIEIDLREMLGETDLPPKIQ